MGGSRLARGGDGAARARHPVIRPEADQVFFAERPWRDARGQGPAGGQRPVRDEDRRQEIVGTIGRPGSGSPVPATPVSGFSGRGVGS
jgi:hypothetical protein